MTPAERLARSVLAVASVYDHHVREPDRNVVTAWARVLDGLDPDRVVRAVEKHYRESTDTLMPAHITALVEHIGADPTRHPGYRPLREALAAADHGPGDLLAADRNAPVPALPLGAVRFGAEALTAAQHWGTSRPTGYVNRRRRGGVARSQRPPAPEGVTICHGCAVDIPAPAGWDPTDPAAGPLYCGRCAPPETR